ncbi:MAG TPA: BamA/TamA family outer membrane protein [Chitinophagaceae bacterium]|nr:BamA/TamA family outer membrane protein [Chitinophagaceae bacterium]HMX76529.1 BamA/TamA family outer membrane protein [Chitinophagaceae bacterium]HNA95583.1 BamA/TamA family outer membrane protein [Chitinophagaceae bacterium]HND96527.1 BamA/TamA family outer membrane protein [Chitinophagaceae bacterium]HNF37907.1 BamA/TamA family outer membrane protein [Chitinophagaceae bacterium]
MRKFHTKILVPILMLAALNGNAQKPAAATVSSYTLWVSGVDKDSAWIVSKTGLQTSFASKLACEEYLNRLPALLQSKGYVTASIDLLQYGMTTARLVLFLGESYRWIKLDVASVPSDLLEVAGWREKQFSGKPLDFVMLQQFQEKMLYRLENTGHPFARIFLDSIILDKEAVTASLKVNKGPAYKIDSIRIYGNGKISNAYLQRYLNIPNGSSYNKEKLLQVDKKLAELAYVESERSADITLLNTGSVLNVYLKQKKSSQINALIGFLPNNDQLSSKKLLITGEANILLRNSLGAGETIGLNWQQIQVKSPRLNFIYQHPFIFKSNVGLDFSFDMFKKDSSFLNVNFQLGALYALNTTQSARLFVQRFQTIVSSGGLNTPAVIQTRTLPDAGDVSWLNIGLDYELNTTDYRLNPRSGNELRIITSGGSKKIKRNNEILQLKDPNDPGFDFAKLYDTINLNAAQVRIKSTAAHYFPLGKSQRSVFKTALNAGYFQSRNFFRNELFQLGGYKLLRGFDEESQYLSRYAIATLEYHYLVGRNSYFYVLADGGWGRGLNAGNKIDYTYFGTGLGLAFETKAGIFNLALAVGKRNDFPFDLRKSKIHVGFANYF